MVHLRGRWRALVVGTTLALAAPVGLGVVATLPSPAVAGSLAEQSVAYRLRYEGRPAGTHSLTVRHFAPKREGGDETRILESYEDIRGPSVPEALWRRTRATARASGDTLSFTAVTETGPEGSGRITEVNGRRDTDGTWSLTVTRGADSQTQELRRSQADLCTLDLFDPLLHTRLLDRGVVRLLDVTTGTVRDGTAADGGELTLDLPAGSTPVRRSVMESDGSTWQWDRNLEGLVVRYDSRLGDSPLTAQAESLPPPRSWGAVEASTRFDNGIPIVQDDL